MTPYQIAILRLRARYERRFGREAAERRCDTTSITQRWSWRRNWWHVRARLGGEGRP